VSHLSDEQFHRFASGQLDDRELDDVLLHLESCALCGRAGEVRAADDLAMLRSELMTGETPSRTRAWWWVAAAALAAAIAGVIALRDDPPVRPERVAPVVVRTPPAAKPGGLKPAAPPAPQYADAEWGRLVARAVATARLPFPAELAALQAPADIVRGSSEAIERVAPTGIVVDDVRPTFTWPAREGTHTVSVFDDTREVIRSAPLKRARWTPDRDLPRGRTLSWQVEVTRDGAIETIPRPPAPPALFRIAGAAEHRQLERARAEHPNDFLLHSVLYARAGMRREALASLQRAAAADTAARRILDHETSP
jgi:hypothetical protein